MRIWFDTEFIDDGRTVDLISIGMVREDGAELYLESSEADKSRADPWLVKNVFPYLTGPALPRQAIASLVLDFAGKSPEFWADHAAYDWLVLCQLYGRMIDIPDGWPWYCLDIQQLQHRFDDAYVLPPAFIGNMHNALDDARHCRRLWTYLTTANLSERTR